MAFDKAHFTHGFISVQTNMSLHRRHQISHHPFSREVQLTGKNPRKYARNIFPMISTRNS